MKLYDQKQDLFFYDRFDAIDISIVDEVQRDIILKGIDSISHVNKWNFTKDISRLSLKLVFKRYYEPYKIRKTIVNPDEYIPASILEISFFDSNYNIGVCADDVCSSYLIYFDSISSKLIETLRTKRLKSKLQKKIPDEPF